MDKQVIQKQGDKFILVDKNITEFSIDTEVDLLTVTKSGNILGRNMLYGSVLNHCPYMQQAEVSDEKLQQMLAEVTVDHDYGIDRKKVEQAYDKLI